MLRIRDENRIQKENELSKPTSQYEKDLIKNSILLLHASSCKIFLCYFRYGSDKRNAFSLLPYFPYCYIMVVVKERERER